ncbi:hypothetical protein GGS21DRAFT_217711 [Xylaria nigripes]|nr:hypothetical protein GGS21DRAFT_217711 [Xylaria nigripes]
MLFKITALSFLAALVAADGISDAAAKIPDCAKSCLQDATTKAGCQPTDYKCMCNSISDVSGSSVLCAAAVCQGDDAGDFPKDLTELCLAVAKSAGEDAFSSALDSIGSAATSIVSDATGLIGSGFTAATGVVGSGFTAATGVVGSGFTEATGVVGSEITKATGAIASDFTSATGAAGSFIATATNDVVPTPTSAGSANDHTGAAAHISGLGLAGAAALFAFAL